MSISVYEWDDFGCNHEISSMCQSHDCRDQLLRLKEVNPDFKATLFSIPGEMTFELLKWCHDNKDWIELAYHGLFHSSNYECEKMSYEEFDSMMLAFQVCYGAYFVEGFRAPGWQISDDVFQWLEDNDWWVADQSYNDQRRPNMNAYVNMNGQFIVHNRNSANYLPVDAYHGHTWNVGSVGSVPANGIYEDYDNVERLVRESKEFKFVSELFDES